MSPLKWVFTDLGMLLVSFILSAWMLSYFLAKARDVDSSWIRAKMDRFLQVGNGHEWMQLTMLEKRCVCEEVAHRFSTDKSELSAVCYYLYLEKVFSKPESRNLLISDMLIEAEVHRSKAEPPPEIKDTII